MKRTAIELPAPNIEPTGDDEEKNWSMLGEPGR
jgi:hypothetical protein